ncbi:MAG: hypothetical protein H6644_01430 [Caldilineaceae bacterium]|nr:hypothetical protein [Caldilineaceae bacterium]
MGGGQCPQQPGNATRRLRDFDRAQALYAESLRINRQLGDRWALAYLLEDMGVLAAQMDQPVRGALSGGAAATARAAIGAPAPPPRPEKLDQALPAGHRPARLGHRRRTLAQGAIDLALDEIVACALDERPFPPKNDLDSV